MPIRSVTLDENVKGIGNHDGDKGMYAISLGRKIISNHNYKIHRFSKLNDIVLPDRYNDGKLTFSDIIRYNNITEDKFNLKDNKPLIYNGRNFNSNNSFFTIEYRSNNFQTEGSIYVKLMNFRGWRCYKPCKSTGESAIDKYLRMDKEKPTKDPMFASRIEKYFSNKQLLGSSNYSDYFFYVKYTELDDNQAELDEGYLVPGNALRYQVVTILNYILEKGGVTELIPFNRDYQNLNASISRAYKICLETPNILKPPMDLFRLKKDPYKKRDNGIILRIPEKHLTDHIKFNSEGQIIN